MALLHHSKLLLAFVLLAPLVTVAPANGEAQERSGFHLSLSTSAEIGNEVEIRIASDRPLREHPTLYVTEVSDEDGTAPVFTTNERGRTVPIDGQKGPVIQATYRTYRYVHSGPDSGVYSVYVEAEDTHGSRCTAGSPLSSADTTSFTFELDKALNGGVAPTWTVNGLTSTVANAEVPELEMYGPIIVETEFSRESGEYPGDSYETVTLTSAELVAEFRNGRKETTNLNLAHHIATPDNIQYAIVLPGLKVGSYTLTVKASDAAGNTSAKGGHVVRWNVVPLKPVTIDLAPGWNLISLPFHPYSPAINSVIPADHPADIIMTYDNEARVWEVSRRDSETGLFTGEIEILTKTMAYFVRTDSIQGLSLYRPLPCTSCSPPFPVYIAVVEGWNLVPVVTNRFPTPTTIPADYYFGTLGDNSWLKALTFNTLDETWESVAPGETVPDGDDEDTEPDLATLKVGKGYWLYASKDGVIYPSGSHL